MKILTPVLWLAVLLVPALSLAQPKLSAASAILMDAETGKILFYKNADVSRFPASTTKIMTAMLLLENCTPDEMITAPADITKVNQASMHLHPGEKISAADMLYGLLLRSGNDGCVAVATHISGSVEKFCELMNKRAKELGCTNTHFNNPHGLNDDKHTTTAHDLAIIARHAMTYPAFAKAVKTYKYVITRDPKLTKDTLMINHDKYLLKDPTADGIKTGWTVPAGRCFVGSATRDNYRLISVVLKSQDWQKDNAELLNWGFANHQRELALSSEKLLGPIKVLGGTKAEVMLQPSNSIVHVWKRGLSPEAKASFDYTKEISAPVKKGDRVGGVRYTDEDGFVQTASLLATEDIPQSTVSRLTGTASSGTFYLFGGCLGFGAFYMRRKAQKMKARQMRARARARLT